LIKAGLTLAIIKKVVVCGGVTKMPRLREAIQKVFPESEILTTLTADDGLSHWDAVTKLQL